MLKDSYKAIQHLIDIRRLYEARNEIENGLKLEPQDTTLLSMLAYICWLEDNFEDGIEIAHKGLSYDPDDEYLKYVLFLLLHGDEQYEKAELIIIELIRSNPRDDEYLRGYAEVMLFTFHLVKAKKLIAEALRIAPDSSSNQLVATLIDIADGRLSDADKKLSKLIEEKPDDEHILRMLLVQLVSKKKFRAAQVLAQTLLRRNPYDQHLIDTIVELRTCTHWSAIPLWPTYKLGWLGSIGMWAIFIVLVNVNKQVEHPAFSYVVWGYLGWCIYSWIHQPLFRKIFKVRGV